MTTGRVAVPAPEQLPFSNDRGLPEADIPSPPATLRVSDWCPQDIVDEWGVQSFPASDPPANW